MQKWCHYVAALNARSSGSYFGVQFSWFEFGDKRMIQAALVCPWKYSKALELPVSYVDNQDEPASNIFCAFAGPEFGFSLSATKASIVDYPSRDTHYGRPRNYVHGVVVCDGMKWAVDGVACFDREVFTGKKLRPGETGWEWRVAWFDDGVTEIDYVYTGENPREEMHYRSGMAHGDVVFERIGPPQEWKRGERGMAFSYTEELCAVSGTGLDGKRVNGRGYREIVGYDGTPDI